MSSQHKPNRLAGEQSPYLLQHAYNPVDWYPWGEEALSRARSEDKPILVSIGYSSCHWCHVMERESFEDASTAAFMNRHFINIKVDREERPDVDEVYMEAVQYISGQGGWPLHCFLLPDGKPFYGGTYFPPIPSYNRPSWMQILIHCSRLYLDKRDRVQKQAERLTGLIEEGSARFLTKDPLSPPEPVSGTLATEIWTVLEKNFDRKNGGFGGAPKFPHFMTIDLLLLLDHYHQTTGGNEHATFSLDRMVRGGIYDQLGGGISRYATDSNWNIPHFEKMLYDNALLVGSLAKRARTDANPIWKDRIEDVLEFLDRDFREEGGYISAWDADSEGEEGKYYVWTAEEWRTLTDGDEWIFEYFNIKEEGNWEKKKNILWREAELDVFSVQKGLDPEAIQERWEHLRKKLLSQREGRVKPGEDDKVILSWNAILSWSMAEAAPLGVEEGWRKRGKDHIQWLMDTFYHPEEITLDRIYKNGKTYQDGLLEDYAYLVKALLAWFAVEQNLEWLQIAKSLTDRCFQLFFDEEADAFQSGSDEALPVRQISLYDNSTPSANAIMVENLLYLGSFYEEETYRTLAEKVLDRMVPSILSYPLAFSYWAQLMVKREWGFREISVIGRDSHEIVNSIQEKWWLPEGIFFARQHEDSSWPLSIHKEGGEKTYIYLCDRYGCRPPVENTGQLKSIL